MGRPNTEDGRSVVGSEGLVKHLHSLRDRPIICHSIFTVPFSLKKQHDDYRSPVHVSHFYIIHSLHTKGNILLEAN